MKRRNFMKSSHPTGLNRMHRDILLEKEAKMQIRIMKIEKTTLDKPFKRQPIKHRFSKHCKNIACRFLGCKWKFIKSYFSKEDNLAVISLYGCVRENCENRYIKAGQERGFVQGDPFSNAEAIKKGLGSASEIKNKIV